jgi:DNA polymerase III gamma/tau subunit
MQSILIVGSKEEAREKASSLCSEFKISKFDIDTIETEKALGISEIRLLQKRIFLKPIKSEKKTVILEAFFGMTLEAQNAFLKLLEEPPANTIIIMLVLETDSLLPTVLSRCNILNLKITKKLGDENLLKNLKILEDLTKSKNALFLAQNNGKSREEALNFLEDLILTSEKNLETDKKLAKLIKKMQKTYFIIKTTNVSPRFALENLFLSLNTI